MLLRSDRPDQNLKFGLRFSLGSPYVSQTELAKRSQTGFSESARRIRGVLGGAATKSPRMACWGSVAKPSEETEAADNLLIWTADAFLTRHSTAFLFSALNRIGDVIPGLTTL